MPLLPLAHSAARALGFKFKVKYSPAVVAGADFIAGAKGVCVLGIQGHEAAAANVIVRGLLAVDLYQGHRLALVAVGHAQELLEGFAAWSRRA